MLKMSPSPHIHFEESTRSIMLDVIIALVPALIWGVFAFGARALSVTAICVISAILTEYIYRFISKKSNTVGDLSAAVTGLLLALSLPVTTPLWICVIGSVFAIGVVKQLFGGIGKNVVNPALASRVFLFSSYPQYLSGDAFTPFGERFAFIGAHDTADAIVGATPLGAAEVEESIFELFLGRHAGTIGELSEALLILGALYLLYKKVISLHIPVSFILTVAIITFIFPQGNSASLDFMLTELFSGGLFLGAIFMATDYVTSPVTKWGRIIFGVGCGLITVFIRYFGGYPEGVSFAILIMNLLVWYIDIFTRPRAFGRRGEAKE